MPTNFPAIAKTTGLVDTMVKVDEHFDALKAIRSAGFRTPAKQPDLSPVNKSLQLWELLREAHRTRLDAQRGEKFLTEWGKAETAASDLHARLKEFTAVNGAGKLEAVEAAFQAVTKSCSSCHKAFRD